MPGQDGFALCAQLRATPQGSETPVIFLTALRDVDTFDRAQKVGATDYLTKPVQPAELIVRVQSALKLTRMSAELREQYELVKRQRDDLMRLQLQKERLTAFVIHDLKNPVNSMDLHAQLLLRDKELPEKVKDSAQHIRDEARSLLRLVLNLLDISKSEEGRLVAVREHIDLETLTAEIGEALSLRMRNAEVAFERAIHVPRVMGDQDLLRRVIENLLDNAIRHAPRGSIVWVSADPCPSGVQIRVTDQGTGIAPHLRDRVFDRFVQLENSDKTRTRTGRGLGLAFCKLAVEAQGGTICVEDGSPGTIFCVSLPP